MTIANNTKKMIESASSNWLIVLLVLAILLAIFMYFRSRVKFEGFTQKERYAMNRGSDAYDDFYAGIYDHLYKSEARAKYESMQIVKSTQPDKDHSRFLDIGCGTGCLVNEIQSLGYKVQGIDRSAAMLKEGREKHDGCPMMQGDARDSMSFERGSFTHILCMNRTIYEFADKVEFFRNCAHWLVPGGYLIVHMVTPEKFDPIIPLGKTRLFDSPQEYSKSRITNTLVDFIDFKYKSAFDFDKVGENGVVVQMETFTDMASNHVRQNEHVLHMESERDLLAKAQFCGFVLAGEFTMETYNKDPYQRVYILQKM